MNCLSNAEFDWERTWSGGDQANDKAVGTFVFIVKMLKAPGDERVQQIRGLIENIIHFGKIPTKLDQRIIASRLQGQGLTPFSEETIKTFELPRRC